jgi:hypothetical protein
VNSTITSYIEAVKYFRECGTFIDVQLHREPESGIGSVADSSLAGSHLLDLSVLRTIQREETSPLPRCLCGRNTSSISTNSTLKSFWAVDEVYAINLKRRPDRWAQLQQKVINLTNSVLPVCATPVSQTPSSSEPLGTAHDDTDSTSLPSQQQQHTVSQSDDNSGICAFAELLCTPCRFPGFDGRSYKPYSHAEHAAMVNPSLPLSSTGSKTTGRREKKSRKDKNISMKHASTAQTLLTDSSRHKFPEIPLGVKNIFANNDFHWHPGEHAYGGRYVYIGSVHSALPVQRTLYITHTQLFDCFYLRP